MCHDWNFRGRHLFVLQQKLIGRHDVKHTGERPTSFIFDLPPVSWHVMLRTPGICNTIENRHPCVAL